MKGSIRCETYVDITAEVLLLPGEINISIKRPEGINEEDFVECFSDIDLDELVVDFVEWYHKSKRENEDLTRILKGG